MTELFGQVRGEESSTAIHLLAGTWRGCTAAWLTVWDGRGREENTAEFAFFVACTQPHVHDDAVIFGPVARRKDVALSFVGSVQAFFRVQACWERVSRVIIFSVFLAFRVRENIARRISCCCSSECALCPRRCPRLMRHHHRCCLLVGRGGC